MSRGQVFSLWLAAGLFILLAVYPASAETVTDGISPEYEEGKINLTEYSANSYNETESIETELGLGFKFLKSMLSLLHLNLNLINETLSERSEEYPFLQPTIEGTSTGINAVNSTIDFVDDPTNMSKANATMHTFDSAIEDLNASLVYPQDMLDAANATLRSPEATTPILEDMYRITRAMITVYDHMEN
ncbi:MAG: hypothetical protein AAGU10_08800 [Methanosarcina mazei]